MSRLGCVGMATVAVVMGCCLGGCPPPGEQRSLVKPAASGEGGQDLFSVAGMTRAVEQLDAARGTPAEAELRARYEKLFKTEPQDPFKRFLWAYSLSDRNLAWQELAKVTKLNARFYWAYLGMGSILDGWKVYDQAAANFEKALELGPGIAIGYDRFGRMRLHQGQPKKAVELLEQAVAKAPGQAAYRLDLARALSAAGQQARARDEYQKVIAADPKSFAARAELGRLLEKMGQPEAAAEALAEAAELDPKAFGVRFERAGLLAKLGRNDQAVAAYREACGLKPDDLACWQALAALAEKLGNKDLQVEADEQVVRIDPENVPAQAFLAPIYLEQGAIEKALPAYQLLLAKKPDDLEALLGLARIYEQGEEFSRALEFYQRVLDQKPDQPQAKKAQQGLFERFHILPEPISGKSPEKVFAANRRQIAAVYKQRLEKHPGLQGDLLLKVAVDDQGRVGEVTVAKDTVGDPVIDLCAVWNLKRSHFPAGFGATYDFELTLKPGVR